MKRLLIAVFALAALAALLLVARNLSRGLPNGPVEPSWDRETCAHCRMHVGEPPFAAQVQTADGAVLFFDDPGCLFEYLAENPVAVRAAYFHALEGDGWIPMPDAAFVHVSPSPMGFGLGAVRAGTPGAVTVEEARGSVLAGKQSEEPDGSGRL